MANILPDLDEDKISETFQSWGEFLQITEISSSNTAFKPMLEELTFVATEAVYRLGIYLPEVYTADHIKTWQALNDLFKKMIVGFDSLKGQFPLAFANLKNARFSILKKLFHLLVRPDPKNEMKIPNEVEIVTLREESLKGMKDVCNTARKYLKKSSSNIDYLLKYIESKKTNNFLDSLIVDYYTALYLNKKPISALKSLYFIFNYIRSHADRVSRRQVEYFTGEFELLSRFIKIFILYRELDKASKDTKIPKWMQKTYLNIANTLMESIRKNFKYELPQAIDNRLLRVQTQNTCGRFLEFLIPYLLKELLKNNWGFAPDENWPPAIRTFFSTLQPPLKAEDVKVNYRPINNGPDLDVFVNNRSFLSIKTGSISRGDLTTFKRELGIAKSLNVPRMFFAYDTTRNHTVGTQITHFVENIGVDDRFCTIDLKLILGYLFKFVKQVPAIELPLGKSMLFELSGFQE